MLHYRKPRSIALKRLMARANLPTIVGLDKGMTPEQWKRTKQLFEAALEVEAAKRPAFLEAACQGNAEVRVEVERLLAEDEIAGGFLDEPLVAVQVNVLRAGMR